MLVAAGVFFFCRIRCYYQQIWIQNRKYINIQNTIEKYQFAQTEVGSGEKKKVIRTEIYTQKKTAPPTTTTEKNGQNVFRFCVGDKAESRRHWLRLSSWATTCSLRIMPKWVQSKIVLDFFLFEQQTCTDTYTLNRFLKHFKIQQITLELLFFSLFLFLRPTISICSYSLYFIRRTRYIVFRIYKYVDCTTMYSECSHTQ